MVVRVGGPPVGPETACASMLVPLPASQDDQGLHTIFTKARGHTGWGRGAPPCLTGSVLKFTASFGRAELSHFFLALCGAV